MKFQLEFTLSFLFLVLTLSCNEGTSKILKYDINQAEDSYVVLQLKSENKNQDSIKHVQELRNIVDQIRSFNSKLGYDQFAKKVASFELEQHGKEATFMTIRNFDDFDSAETYAQSLEKEFDKEIYGEIGEPFPISLSNYKICVEDKNFKSYYQFYQSTTE